MFVSCVLMSLTAVGPCETRMPYARLKLMDQLHVRPKIFNYSKLHMTSYPDCYSLAPLGLLPLISMGKYIKIDSFHEAKCKRYVYVLLPEQQDTKI